jgi:hypothetical protein
MKWVGMHIKGDEMLTMTDTQILVVTGMLLAVVGTIAYTFDRNAAAQRKRLARVPARESQKRRPAQLPEAESSEISPTVYYLGLLVIAYLLLVVILLAGAG